MTIRIGMLVPSLNTIAEDDFDRFCPDGVRYHVHRIRLRTTPGRVTVDDLGRAYDEAVEAGRTVADLKPQVVAFNCTGASVARGPGGDRLLAERMTQDLGVPATNTMQAIKGALRRFGVRTLVHVCPFAGDSSRIEQESLEHDGFHILKSVALGFSDARTAAGMEVAELAELAATHDQPEADAVLLSCANVRALEAVPEVEAKLGKPVVTSNQAMLWDALRLGGWRGRLQGGGRLMEAVGE